MSSRIVCSVLIVSLIYVPARAQEDLLPDLTIDPTEMEGHELDVDALPGSVVFRFDSSIPNIGAGEFAVVTTGIDSGDGREFVNQRIMLDDDTTRQQDAGDFLYNPANTAMESDGWVDYRIRAILPGNGVGPILREGGKFAVHISSSAVFDGSLPNVPPPGEQIVASGGEQGISVGYTDLYPRFFPMQWVDVTGLASGDYWLEMAIDPGMNILEEDETNNEGRIMVTLNMPDMDGDDLDDVYEGNLGTNPNRADTDADGLTDLEEVAYDGDRDTYDPFHPISNPTGTDLNANVADTDGDGVNDGTELNFGSDPLDPSSVVDVSMNSRPLLIVLFFLLVLLFLRGL